MDIAAPPRPPVLPPPAHTDEAHKPADGHAATPHDGTPAPAKHDAPAVSKEPETPAPLAVQQAPLPPDLSDALEKEDAKTADKTAPTKSTKPLPKGPRAPVGLIIVTILVMMALSGLAVAIYMTSKA
jgi:hypothetical protein